MEPIIDLQNVSVRYQNILALRNISLDIYQGEYIGIFGPNGSGKTTLLKTILGLVHPFEGAIKLFSSTNLKKMRVHIGYIPQNPTVKKTFPASVLETVEMGLYGKIGFLKPIKERHRMLAEKA